MSMKNVALMSLILTGAFGVSTQAASSSGVLVTANAFMYNSTVEQTPGAGAVESKSSIYDMKLGYLSSSGLYLGGIYTIKNSETDSGSTDGSAMGASLGYVGARGFYVKGHYLVSGTYGDFKEGTGVQGDLGYMASVSSSMVVGVELTYRSMEYKKKDGDPSLESYKQSELLPLMTIGFIF